MFKILNTFLTLLALLVVLRWLLPSEIGELASEILIMFLTLIKDLLSQFPA